MQLVDGKLNSCEFLGVLFEVMPMAAGGNPQSAALSGSPVHPKFLSQNAIL